MEKTQEYKSPVYGPTEFHNVEFGDAKAVTAIGDKRIVLNGKLSLNVVKSAKYGREVHLQVYAPAYEVEGRNPSRWSRTEIYFPIRDLERLIEALIKIQLRDEGINV
ncbi:MAG: hypothetical protein J7K62_02440 [Thermoplasmata archaeon]|nr:hypothetical protein [Thermoplasmata archaeon]